MRGKQDDYGLCGRDRTATWEAPEIHRERPSCMGPQGEDRRDSQHPPGAESPPAPPRCQALPPRSGTQVHHLLLEPLTCSNLSVDLCCTPGNMASPFSSPWAFSLPPSLGLLFAIVRIFLFLDLFPIFGDHLLETS